MNTRLASVVLAGSTVVASYIVLLIADIYPKRFANIYGLPSSTHPDILFATCTKFVVRYPWVFVSATALIWLVAVNFVRRFPARVLKFLAIGLSAQALVVWLAMFCFCYEEFQDFISLHHSPRFEFTAFCQFAYGVFPVTLLAIVTPAIIALIPTTPPSISGPTLRR